MSVIRPSDLMKRKREVIDELVRDLSPGVRDSARKYLETLPMEELRDKDRIKDLLRRKGFIR